MQLPDLEQMTDFPFESLDFKIKFEVSDFKLGNETYSFDFYRIAAEDEIKIERDINGIPNLKLNGNATEMKME